MKIKKILFFILLLYGLKIVLDLKFGGSFLSFNLLNLVTKIYDDICKKINESQISNQSKTINEEIIHNIIIDFENLKSTEDILTAFYKYNHLFDPENSKTIQAAIEKFRNVPGAIEKMIQTEEDAEDRLNGPIAIAIQCELYKLVYMTGKIPGEINHIRHILSEVLFKLETALVLEEKGEKVLQFNLKISENS